MAAAVRDEFACIELDQDFCMLHRRPPCLAHSTATRKQAPQTRCATTESSLLFPRAPGKLALAPVRRSRGARATSGQRLSLCACYFFPKSTSTSTSTSTIRAQHSTALQQSSLFPFSPLHPAPNRSPSSRIPHLRLFLSPIVLISSPSSSLYRRVPSALCHRSSSLLSSGCHPRHTCSARIRVSQHLPVI